MALNTRLIPKSVKVAIWLLIISHFVVAPLAGFYSFYAENNHDSQPLGLIILFFLLFFSIAAWLIYKIWQGRNWARILYLINLISGMINAAVMFKIVIGLSTFKLSVGVIITILQVIVCYLLFFGSGASSYFKKNY